MKIFDRGRAPSLSSFASEVIEAQYIYLTVMGHPNPGYLKLETMSLYAVRGMYPFLYSVIYTPAVETWYSLGWITKRSCVRVYCFDC